MQQTHSQEYRYDLPMLTKVIPLIVGVLALLPLVFKDLAFGRRIQQLADSPIALIVVAVFCFAISGLVFWIGTRTIAIHDTTLTAPNGNLRPGTHEVNLRGAKVKLQMGRTIIIKHEGGTAKVDTNYLENKQVAEQFMAELNAAIERANGAGMGQQPTGQTPVGQPPMGQQPHA